ncbi:hypothetical protein BDP27DRAFT_1417480 [Rhodocollybia butyracea]|uniref:Uncharacterized protein n=1 Tax=Rhodocollybia butyracea TaxID=206335 RepID=A0A9P5PZZ7_9AGAR|nr:hypothetical protein BDP27DRAFT_1417480 [Rhodocollybia butyracea]
MPDDLWRDLQIQVPPPESWCFLEGDQVSVTNQFGKTSSLLAECNLANLLPGVGGTVLQVHQYVCNVNLHELGHYSIPFYNLLKTINVGQSVISDTAGNLQEPTASDLVHVNTPGLLGLVRLAPSIISEVINMCDCLRDSISHLSSNLRADAYLQMGQDQMRKYCEPRAEPGAPESVAFLLSALQRVFLETYGRWQWLVKWLPCKENVDKQFSLDSSVMGAFTDNMDVASDLFRLGIPFWFIQTWKEGSEKRIAKIVPPWITLSMELFLSAVQGSRWMFLTDNQHIRLSTRVFQGVLSVMLRWSSLPSLPQASGHVKPSAVDELDVTGVAVVSAPPPLQRLRTGASADQEPERNCFAAIKSDYLPSPLSCWQTGLEKLMELQCHTGKSLLEHLLPHPVTFLTKHNALKFPMLLMWLRIRPVILWRLGLPNASVFTNENWKALIEGVQGAGGPGPAERRTKILAKLCEIVRESGSNGILIDEENIVKLPATWNNKEVKLNSQGLLDHQLMREILWELCEARFWLEIIMLDHAMVPEVQGAEENSEVRRQLRDVKRHLCWPGLPYRPEFQHLGSSSFLKQDVRLPYVKALFDLVSAWPGPKPYLFPKPFPNNPATSFAIEVEEVLANYYICVFVQTFRHPPTIPHIAEPGHHA